MWLLESYENDFTEKKIPAYVARISRLKARFHSTLLQNSSEPLLLVPSSSLTGTSCPLKISPYSIKSLLIGMGMIAASVVSPRGLEESRRLSLQQSLSIPLKTIDGSSDREQSHANLSQRSMATILKAIAERISPSWDEFYGGSAFSLQHSIAKLESALSKAPISTLKALPKPVLKLERSDTQMSKSSPWLETRPTSVPTTPTTPTTDAPTDAKDNGLSLFLYESKLCADIQSTHYYHAEMGFIAALTEISERLFRIPKLSRQKALQAELSLLNHNLPANVCIPFWCCECLRNSIMSHARVLRICPTEAVVLNSAERVPFMILVEIESNCIHESSPEAASFSSSSSSSSSSTSPPEVEGFIKEENEPTYSMVHSSNTCEFYDKMRTAAILLAQLHHMTITKNLNPTVISTIRSRIIKEMELLDTQKVKTSSEIPGTASFISMGNDECRNIIDDLALVKDQRLHEDPSCNRGAT